MTVHHQQRQPVVRGAFGKGHRQHHHANQHQLHIAIEGQPFFTRFSLTRDVPAVAIRDGGDPQQNRGDTDQRGQQSMCRSGNAGGGQGHADTGACQRAKAVKPVHHRQHGFVHLLLDGCAFDVNRHFRRAKTAAKHGQPDGKRQRGGEPQRNAEHHHTHNRAAHGGTDHCPRAEPLNQPGGTENAAHRAYRQAK